MIQNSLDSFYTERAEILLSEMTNPIWSVNKTKGLIKDILDRFAEKRDGMIIMRDAIIVDGDVYNTFHVPIEKAESDPDYVKHVYCDGARFHVISYSSDGMHCSEPNCIINKRTDETKHEKDSR